MTRSKKNPTILSSTYLITVFASILSSFIEYKHLTIARFIPTYADQNYIFIWVFAFFFSIQFFIIVLYRIKIEERLSVFFGFYTGIFVLFLLSYTPAMFAQVFITITGMTGFFWGGYQLLQGMEKTRNWVTLVAAIIAGACIIPVVWAAVAWILFALPHSDFLTVFSILHGHQYVVPDLLHFLAYSQMIHEYGVPSVGMNGLAFHNYHWLSGYYVSSLANLSGQSVPTIVGGFTGTFLAPLLLFALFIGACLSTSSQLSRVITVIIIFALFGIASQTLPTVAYGLVFLSPSMATSLAFIAPLAGLAVSLFNGHIRSLKPEFFWLLVPIVLMIGIAKITTLPHAFIIVSAIGVQLLLQDNPAVIRKAHIVLGTCALSLGTLVLFQIAFNQLSTDGMDPDGYLTMLGDLTPSEKANLLQDIQSSRDTMPNTQSAGRTDYEKSNFWTSPQAIIAILLLIVSFGAATAFHLKQKTFWSGVGLFSCLVGLGGYLTLRLFVGNNQPVQAVYVIAPILLFAIYLITATAGSSITRMGSKITSSQPERLSFYSLFCVLFMFSIINIIVSLSAEKWIQGAAAQRAVDTVGQLANEKGKKLIRSIVAERSKIFEIAPKTGWPPSARRYWEHWNSRLLKEILDEGLGIKKEIEAKSERAAIFVPATHPLWTEVYGYQKSLWVPALVGTPVYRGRIRRSEAASQLPYRGRGFSDFGHEAASPISSFENVHCWSRFKGWTIVELGTLRQLKC